MNAAEWVVQHGEAAGESAEQTAFAVVTDGLRPRLVGPDDVLTLEFRPDRVTIEADAHGRVVRVRAG